MLCCVLYVCCDMYDMYVMLCMWVSLRVWRMCVSLYACYVCVYVCQAMYVMYVFLYVVNNCVFTYFMYVANVHIICYVCMWCYACKL